MVPAQTAGVVRPDYDEPTSYWQTAVAPPMLSAELPPTADVAVVGGGIVGTATVYWLARAGARTVLIERHAPAYGATGRNAGFVTVGPAEGYPAAIRRLGHATARSVYQLTVENRESLREVLFAEEIACDYREPGSLGLALGSDQQAAASLTVEAIRADAFQQCCSTGRKRRSWPARHWDTRQPAVSFFRDVGSSIPHGSCTASSRRHSATVHRPSRQT